MIPNHYKTLGIDPTAVKDEIKRAYRRLALKYHPDVNSNHDAHDTFIAINEAYLILSDDDARGKYDREFKMYSTSSANGPFNTSTSEGGERPFEDESLNQWTTNARNQAESYAAMAFADFSKLIVGIVKETGFQLSNALLLMVGIVLIVSGIGNILLGLMSESGMGNPIVGFIMLPIGYFLRKLALKNHKDHEA
jgi:curved DNA-binding protein CbpA